LELNDHIVSYRPNSNYLNSFKTLLKLTYAKQENRGDNVSEIMQDGDTIISYR